jgi:hypothetical protein
MHASSGKTLPALAAKIRVGVALSFPSAVGSVVDRVLICSCYMLVSTINMDRHRGNPPEALGMASSSEGGATRMTSPWSAVKSNNA